MVFGLIDGTGSKGKDRREEEGGIEMKGKERGADREGKERGIEKRREGC